MNKKAHFLVPSLFPIALSQRLGWNQDQFLIDIHKRTSSICKNFDFLFTLYLYKRLDSDEGRESRRAKKVFIKLIEKSFLKNVHRFVSFLKNVHRNEPICLQK
jgi:hypothetical protein